MNDMLSVVVPTHNRAESVIRLASSLDSQECAFPYEVVFVLDGCMDDTNDRLSALSTRMPMRMVETSGLGAAAARNAGVAHASGDLIVFLDDDEVAQPGMLNAHLAAHGTHDGVVAIGPVPYAPDMTVTPLDFFARDWWQSRYRALADPTHHFTYRDCCTGNLSMSRDRFREVGGFDEGFLFDGREDYELGVRLLESGVTMKFAPEALAYHYPTNKPSSLLRKWRTFGSADVRFVEKHPEVFQSLPLRYLVRKPRWKDACAARLARVSPRAGTRFLSMLGSLLDRHPEKLWDWRVCGVWSRCQRLSYLYGVLSAVGGPRGLDAFTRKYMDPAEWPRCRTRIADLDILSGFPEMSDTDKCDKLFLVARAGRSVVGWMGVSYQRGQDSVQSGDILESMSDHMGWLVWRSCSGPGEQRTIEQSDSVAWHRIGRKMKSLSLDDSPVLDRPSTMGRPRSATAFVLQDGGPETEVPACRESAIGQVVSLTVDGDIVGRIGTALRHGRGRYFVLLKPGDALDAGWSEAALRHFSDGRAGCVITPVLMRNTCTRGDELYHELADFQRARTWAPNRVTEWMRPADILCGFNTSCHRFVFDRDTLRKACVGQADDADGVVSRLVFSAIQQRVSITYDPLAVVWRQSGMRVEEVRRAALEHSFRTFRRAGEGFRTAGVRRSWALGIVSRLLTSECRRFRRCVSGRLDWPTTFMLSQNVWALRGLWHGLLGKNDSSDRASLSAREDGGMG